MVELTEITEEAQLLDSQHQQQAKNNKFAGEKAGDSTDDEAYSSDEEDDFDENETLYDRIVALKDIISPKQRKRLSQAYSTTVWMFQGLFSKGGNVVWALTTSALLLGVPLSLSLLAEQQLIEMEKNFDLQKDANEILAAGNAPAPATAGL
ncbi:AGR345Cp [Eremothecium gossypii ATCC 10895]|uniref:AGR345Cp n=1 Tax=Eremothecium gossypii (strain ATCC 10895 / CBS 109.51 / FGSC 9923 / NRRL Y-1056) TaxID=284811 RepID=Q74Z61_EREGS|nr:AGR345Cp [Eremothecium gossypii ATCC 10895]AAS54835.1 AGR345Cp [Eremothecium gossypii ATCC 10895]AEY99167.1 FAGR345Cp [Eremothecium gossypii FDAG1]